MNNEDEKKLLYSVDLEKLLYHYKTINGKVFRLKENNNNSF